MLKERLVKPAMNFAKKKATLFNCQSEYPGQPAGAEEPFPLIQGEHTGQSPVEF